MGIREYSTSTRNSPGLTGGTRSPNPGNPPTPYFQLQAESLIADVGSQVPVTGCIGYAWDRFLGYVKGGGAWERDELTITDTFFGISSWRLSITMEARSALKPWRELWPAMETDIFN
jgi:hypothetical protein